jgi:hypothetical protein
VVQRRKTRIETKTVSTAKIITLLSFLHLNAFIAVHETAFDKKTPSSIICIDKMNSEFSALFYWEAIFVLQRNTLPSMLSKRGLCCKRPDASMTRISIQGAASR